MILGRLRGDYHRMSKPREIEEIADLYLIRPLGFLIVQLFRPTPITPTMVSVLAVLAGWWSAWLYFQTERLGHVMWLSTLAAVALLLHSALDSADGQLARLKHLHSPLGRIIDGFCDNLAFLAIYVGIALGYWLRVGDHLLPVLALATVAGVSHSVQSSLTDYQRTLYAKIALGTKNLDASAPEEIEAAGFGGRLLQSLHLAYFRQQRAVLSSTRRLEDWLAEWVGTSEERRRIVASVYTEHQRGMLRPWALLAPNSHKIGIVLAAFLPLSVGWDLGMLWYFIYDLALNLAMIALIVAQSVANRRTRRALVAVSS